MPDATERAAAALADLDGFATPAAAGTLTALLADDEAVSCAVLLAADPAAAAIVTDRRLVVLVGDPPAALDLPRAVLGVVMTDDAACAVEAEVGPGGRLLVLSADDVGARDALADALRGSGRPRDPTRAELDAAAAINRREPPQAPVAADPAE